MVKKKRTRFHQLPGILLVLIDAAAIGLALIIFALFDHAWTRPMETQVSEATLQLLAQQQAQQQPQEQQLQQQPQEQQPQQQQPQQQQTAALGAKFANRFTDGEPYWDGNSYVGRNLSVTYFNGQFGDSVYFVQDIYVRNIECFKTAFGKDTYGKNYTEDGLQLALRKGALGAINSDYYCTGSLNVIVRNGEIYRDTVDPFESLLALFRDGTMEIYTNGEFTIEELIQRGVWQTWSFGPSLLTENGEAITNFNFTDAGLNPRTAIGMVEPGHYMFVVVDGRQPGYSAGMSHEELSALCASLGLKIAYNLDGGDTTRMVFNGQYVNCPSGDREMPDIIYITDIYE